MRYLLLCCINEDLWNGLPTGERDRVMREYAAWVQGLEKSGTHLASAQLQPSATATTIRVSAGKPVISDGPFAETKEQLGGYHLIKCANLDEALSMAARVPTLRVGGSIEVRALVS
ncbi:MAG: YciI family protein, partial [Woeseiaceae bacterium]